MDRYKSLAMPGMNGSRTDFSASIHTIFRALISVLICVPLCALILSHHFTEALADGLGNLSPKQEYASKRIEAGQQQLSPGLGIAEVSALETEIDPAAYQVGPGDQLVLYIGGSTDLMIPLVVSADGSVVVPSVGVFHSGIMTLSQLEELVGKQCQQAYGSSEIALTLLRPAPLRFPVTGLVVEPGVYNSHAAVRLGDLIGYSGGLGNGANSRAIILMRKDGSRLTCDYLAWTVDGDDSGNPILQSGDRIHVPAASAFYRVRGAFPGTRQEIIRQNSLLDRPFYSRTILVPATSGDPLDFVLRAAGGLSESFCANYIIIHQSDPEATSAPTTQNISLDKTSASIIKPGDTIEIPFCQEWVSVTGAVTRPGLYPFLPGQTVVDYVVAAGGPNDKGSSGGWRFIDPVSGNKSSADSNDTVPAGAMIQVPERRLQKFTSFITPFISAAALVVSIIAVNK